MTSFADRINKTQLLIAGAIFVLLQLAGLPASAAGVTINVKQAPFNAKGDGVTDDTAAIQSAIDAAEASPGSTVFFPSGIYSYSSQLTVEGNVKLKGVAIFGSTLAAKGKANVRFSGSNDSVSFLTFNSSSIIGFYDVDNLQVDNCTFRSALVTRGINSQFSNCKFDAPGSSPLTLDTSSNITVTNSKLSGGSEYAIYNLRSHNVIYRNLALNAIASGFVMQSSNNVLVENSTISFADEYGIRSIIGTNTSLKGNTVTGIGQTAPDYGISTTADVSSAVTDNKVSNVRIGLSIDSASAQVLRNTITKTVSSGITVAASNYAVIASNQLSQIGGRAIGSSNRSGTASIQSNIISNCGLNGPTNAVIGVGGANYTPTIQGNIYTGNKTGIDYFIRCVVPSPPAVVKGNITPTMLPTLVGP